MSTADTTISDQLYRDIYEFSPLGIYTLDRDGIITSFNPQMERISGDRKEQAIGLNALDLSSYQQVGLDKDFLQGIAGKGFEREVEYTSYVSNKPSIRYYRGVPIEDTGVPGQARLLLIVEDITDRKNTERSLERLARFTAENTNPVMRIEQNGQIVLTNDSAERIMATWEPEALDSLTTAVQQSLRENKNESIDIHHEDRTFLFELIPQQEGGYVNVYGRDITAERRAQEIKDHFLSVTSHELRTPMTVARGYVDLMLKDTEHPVTESHRGYLEKIGRNCTKLITFVNDLLDLTKLESGKFTIKTSAFDLAAIIRQVADDFSLMYQQAGITITADVQASYVFADPQQCERIVTNLLSNALKYTHKGGSVTVSLTTRPDNTTVMSVADTGIGISPKDKELLFKEYSQIDSGSVTHMAGTGLGLAICKELIEDMHGKIWLESTLDKGSTFYVALPRIEH